MIQLASTRRRRRTLALVASAALLLGACGTTSDTGDAADSGEPGPGVSADTLKIGVIAQSAKNSAGGGGFIVPDYGDIPAAIDAIVEDINGNGGVAGRQLEVVKLEFDSSTSSPQTENAVCTKFTQDEKVFAVVLVAQREQSARECYKKAKTLMIDAGGVSLSQDVYKGLAPYLWAPSFPTLEAGTASLVPALQEQGFFEGDVSVGALIEKGGSYADVVDSTLKPALEEAGVELAAVGEIDWSSSENAGASVGPALTAFKEADVNRLIFLGRGDNVGFFASVASPQGFNPRIALSSFESPKFILDNPTFHPPAFIKDAVGIGFFPPRDAIGDQLPFPDGDAETACINVLKEAGITYETRPNALRAELYCDAFLFLKAAGDKIGKEGVVNADNFETAAFSLGEEYQAAASLGTKYAEDVFAGNAVYRDLQLKTDTFEYTSDEKPLTS